jgi:hypothetical protein
MSDIFISYRRNDNPDFTLRLRERLVSEFGEGRVFFDQTEIKPGDKFPHRIRDGLLKAKVVLIVIGEYWIKAKSTGLDRLADPEDWVRQEVELALELERGSDERKVIPVLARIENMPAKGTVPESIETLCDYNGVRFEGGLTETDAQWEKLLASVRLLLDGEVDQEPTLLPVLCDRDPQWNQIARRLNEQVQPIALPPAVLVLSGRENEAHDAFVRRMEFDSVREWYRSNQWRGKAIFVRAWEAAPSETFADFAPWFRRLLARELARSTRIASDNELLDAMSKAAVRLVVVILRVHSSEGDKASQLAKMVAEFWRQFPAPPPELGLLTLVCFKFSPDPPGLFGGFFSGKARAEKARRVELAKLAADLETETRIRFNLLPELTSPTYPHLDSWLQHPKVRETLKNKVVKAERLRLVLNNRDALPMDDVIVGLDGLLKEFSKLSKP